MAKFKKNIIGLLNLLVVLSAFLWASGEDYKLAKAEDLRRSVETYTETGERR